MVQLKGRMNADHRAHVSYSRQVERDPVGLPVARVRRSPFECPSLCTRGRGVRSVLEDNREGRQSLLCRTRWWFLATFHLAKTYFGCRGAAFVRWYGTDMQALCIDLREPNHARSAIQYHPLSGTCSLKTFRWNQCFVKGVGRPTHRL